LATQTVFPVGERATAVGSEPVATLPVTAGVAPPMPPIRTSFWSARRTANAVLLSGEIATCHGSAPTGISTFLVNVGGVPSAL
jgi:hypothetical protein